MLIRESSLTEVEENSWGVRFSRLFDMSNDSGLFHTYEHLQKLGANEHCAEPAWNQVGDQTFVPLYEAKMVHHYDHHWATYENNGEDLRDCDLEEKQNPEYRSRPRYWVDHYQVALKASDAPSQLITALKKEKWDEVYENLSFWLAGYCLEQNDEKQANQLLEGYADNSDGLFAGQRDYDRAEKLQTDHPIAQEQFDIWQAETDQQCALKKLLIARLPKYLLGWRRNCRNNDERTLIASMIPAYAAGDSMFFLYTGVKSIQKNLALYANLNSLPLDWVSRQKLGGVNFSYYYFKQLPVLPPEKYTQTDLEFIEKRVLELTYTAEDMQPFAEALDYHGEPFKFDPVRRHQLKSELDAFYAKLYGLTRDELRYILDPADVMGSEYPSETFRVLKNKEMKEFGEYRTQRLVLEAWDKLEQQDLEHDAAAEPVMPDFVYPGDDPVQQIYCGLILSTVRQLAPVDKTAIRHIESIVRDIKHRETFLDDEEALPLPDALPSQSAKYDFDRAITSLENQRLIRRSSGQSWAATDAENDGTAIIPDGVEALIAQALRVKDAEDVFNQQTTTTADSHDGKERKSS